MHLSIFWLVVDEQYVYRDAKLSIVIHAASPCCLASCIHWWCTCLTVYGSQINIPILPKFFWTMFNLNLAFEALPSWVMMIRLETTPIRPRTSGVVPCVIHSLGVGEIVYTSTVVEGRYMWSWPLISIWPRTSNVVSGVSLVNIHWLSVGEIVCTVLS